MSTSRIPVRAKSVGYRKLSTQPVSPVENDGGSNKENEQDAPTVAQPGRSSKLRRHRSLKESHEAVGQAFGRISPRPDHDPAFHAISALGIMEQPEEDEFKLPSPKMSLRRALSLGSRSTKVAAGGPASPSHEMLQIEKPITEVPGTELDCKSLSDNSRQQEHVLELGIQQPKRAIQSAERGGYFNERVSNVMPKLSGAPTRSKLEDKRFSSTFARFKARPDSAKTPSPPHQEKSFQRISGYKVERQGLVFVGEGESSKEASSENSPESATILEAFGTNVESKISYPKRRLTSRAVIGRTSNPVNDHEEADKTCVLQGPATPRSRSNPPETPTHPTSCSSDGERQFTRFDSDTIKLQDGEPLYSPTARRFMVMHDDEKSEQRVVPGRAMTPGESPLESRLKDLRKAKAVIANMHRDAATGSPSRDSCILAEVGQQESKQNSKENLVLAEMSEIAEGKQVDRGGDTSKDGVEDSRTPRRYRRHTLDGPRRDQTKYRYNDTSRAIEKQRVIDEKDEPVHEAVVPKVIGWKKAMNLFKKRSGRREAKIGRSLGTSDHLIVDQERVVRSEESDHLITDRETSSWFPGDEAGFAADGKVNEKESLTTGRKGENKSRQKISWLRLCFKRKHKNGGFDPSAPRLIPAQKREPLE